MKIIKFCAAFLILSCCNNVNSFAQTDITSSEELQRQLGAPVKTRGLGVTRSLGGTQSFNSNAGRASLGAIQFEYNSTELTNTGKKQVEELAKAIKALGSESFQIVGHTDASGSEEYNMTLSEKRAKAVAAYLTGQHGIESERINSLGKGESELTDEDDPNSPSNRRVEVVNVKMLN